MAVKTNAIWDVTIPSKPRKGRGRILLFISLVGSKYRLIFTDFVSKNRSKEITPPLMWFSTYNSSQAIESEGITAYEVSENKGPKFFSRISSFRTRFVIAHRDGPSGIKKVAELLCKYLHYHTANYVKKNVTLAQLATGPRAGSGITVIWPNYGSYTGDWEDHKPHGYGKFIRAADNLVFDGYWRSDLKAGYGNVGSHGKDGWFYYLEPSDTPKVTSTQEKYFFHIYFISFATLDPYSN